MATRQELVDHTAIGVTCRNHYGTLADYVASYQHPNEPKHPTGWLEHVPLCTPCATAAVTGAPPRPRLTIHAAAEQRERTATNAARRAARKAAAAAQQRLELDG